MDSEVERHLRQMIFDRLTEITADRGAITRSELESLEVSNQVRRVIDRNRGIWNPRDLNATLSVVSNPKGPYADTHFGDSLLGTTTRPVAQMAPIASCGEPMNWNYPSFCCVLSGQGYSYLSFPFTS